MDDLAHIIEEIGKKWDVNKKISWELAEMVSDAYAEFDSHKQGLSAGLQIRMGKTSTQIYSYRNAWQMKINMYNSPELSVSHYAKMHDLCKPYELSFTDISEYLETAYSEGWSVRQLAQEVANNHDPDQELKDRQYFETTVKRMRKCWSLPLFNEIPKETRAVYYDLLKELEKI